ncbi:hypothetical protein PAPYR_4826 [Paratrimastix pyriformis]|uniref:Uncharacterized protein n=1 Tax=Paratrimastix pyriformis TaxID=342808 RepID=A0ABQ8UMR1_9EUKA|nr:hypothetical protein PAPYR_4826 [Paratrimastix pyriformis]
MERERKAEGCAACPNPAILVKAMSVAQHGQVYMCTELGGFPVQDLDPRPAGPDDGDRAQATQQLLHIVLSPRIPLSLLPPSHPLAINQPSAAALLAAPRPALPAPQTLPAMSGVIETRMLPPPASPNATFLMSSPDALGRVFRGVAMAPASLALGPAPAPCLRHYPLPMHTQLCFSCPACPAAPAIPPEASAPAATAPPCPADAGWCQCGCAVAGGGTLRPHRHYIAVKPGAHGVVLRLQADPILTTTMGAPLLDAILNRLRKQQQPPAPAPPATTPAPTATTSASTTTTTTTTAGTGTSGSAAPVETAGQTGGAAAAVGGASGGGVLVGPGLAAPLLTLTRHLAAWLPLLETVYRIMGTPPTSHPFPVFERRDLTGYMPHVWLRPADPGYLTIAVGGLDSARCRPDPVPLPGSLPPTGPRHHAPISIINININIINININISIITININIININININIITIGAHKPAAASSGQWSAGGDETAGGGV